jgi:integrase
MHEPPRRLRVTAAMSTSHARAGDPPKIVSEMLGHSAVAITLDLYSHVTPSMQAQTDALDSLFGRQTGSR